MCCGRFKDSLLKQNFVNDSLIKVAETVTFMFHDKQNPKPKDAVVEFMKDLLKKSELEIKVRQELIINHGKYDDFDSGQQSICGSELDVNSVEAKNTMNHYASNFRKKRHDSKTRYKNSVYTFNIQEIEEYIETYVTNFINKKGQMNVYKDQTVEIDTECLVVPFLPKQYFEEFSKGNFFTSKKLPLLITAKLSKVDIQGGKLKLYEDPDII